MPGKTNRPYKSPKRTTKKNKRLGDTKSINKKKLDVTTRIRVDEIRLNDSESLDTSFLEGRYEKRANRNASKVKEKILKDDTEKIKKLEKIKKVFYGIAVVATFVLITLFLINVLRKIDFSSKKSEDIKVVDKKEKDDSEVLDSNYLFIGDFHTKKFDFEENELDYHYIKSSEDYLTTKDVLNDMKNKVYQYNPSIVFIELGLADLDKEVSSEDIVDNIDEIIDSIKKNRSYAEICVESIYPINRDVSDFADNAIDDSVENEDIIKINKKLKELAEKKKIVYLDMFNMLEKDGKLNKEYTDNGVYLNDDGYKQVLKLINKEINK